MLTGEISIGSGEYHGSCHLSGILAAFRAEHPNVTYSIYSGNSDNIKERIERGTLDIGLLLEPVEISKYDFLHFPVPETWNALVRSDSPLAQKPVFDATGHCAVPGGVFVPGPDPQRDCQLVRRQRGPTQHYRARQFAVQHGLGHSTRKRRAIHAEARLAA